MIDRKPCCEPGRSLRNWLNTAYVRNDRMALSLSNARRDRAQSQSEAKKPPRLPSAAFAPLLSTVISHRQNIRSRGLNRLSSRRLEAALILSRYNNIRSPTRLGRDIRPSATISSNLARFRRLRSSSIMTVGSHQLLENNSKDLGRFRFARPWMGVVTGGTSADRQAQPFRLPEDRLRRSPEVFKSEL